MTAEPSKLAASVNRRIAAGWQPRGNLLSHGGLVVQAMVRHGESAEGKRILNTSVD